MFLFITAEELLTCLHLGPTISTYPSGIIVTLSFPPFLSHPYTIQQSRIIDLYSSYLADHDARHQT